MPTSAVGTRRSFAGANCRLPVVAMADTYQDGDLSESFLYKCQILFELNGLSVCETRQTISCGGHRVDEPRSEHFPPKYKIGGRGCRPSGGPTLLLEVAVWHPHCSHSSFFTVS